jgi:uncharacterized membrane protein
LPTLPLHPAIVHVPLGLAFVIPLLAVALALAWWRRALPRAAFGVLVGLQALLVAGGVVAMQLGERDEKRVEPIVGERAIETHEERAEAFVWAGGVVLAGAVAILVVPAGAATAVAAVVAAGTLAVAGLAVAAGEAGGEIVYQRGGASAYGPAGGGGGLAVPAARGRHGVDDD